MHFKDQSFFFLVAFSHSTFQLLLKDALLSVLNLLLIGILLNLVNFSVLDKHFS